MKKPNTCDRCKGEHCITAPIQLRVLFGILPQTDAKVFQTKVYYWCGRCRAVMDGKWRHARKD